MSIENLDLGFLRTAMIEERVPIITDRHLPRTDILFDLHRLHMHPMMLVELMHHEQPTAWLRAVDAQIELRAAARAAELIHELDEDGADDRAMLDFQAWLDAERKAIAEIWFREVWGDPENFEAEGLAALLQALRDQRPEPPDTLEP